MTLQRMSVHLDMLASRIFDVEEVLSVLLQKEDRIEGLSISKFQSLDFTRQSLEDCALLLNFLARGTAFEVPLAAPADIASQLKLATTRELVLPSSQRTDNHTSGDIDFL